MNALEKKIVAVCLVAMLVLLPVSAKFSFGKLGKTFVSHDNLKTYALIVWLGWITSSAANHYSEYLEEYILINPEPLHPEVLRVMGFFISLSMAFYLVAISLTGFYFLFVSGSARGRAKAKYTLGKLILGMIFLSISPYLLKLLFLFSGSLTEAILEQADLSIVKDQFTNTLWGGWKGSVVILAPVLSTFFIPGGGLGFMSSGVIARPLARETVLTTYVAGGTTISLVGVTRLTFKEMLGKGLLKGVSYAGVTSSGSLAIYPYFLLVVMILLTFGILAGRYLTLMIWTITFPLAIFLTSFDMTKNIGRVMMEQTLQWTLLQVFYSLTIVALSIGLVILPAEYQGYSLMFMALHSVAVVGVLFMGPWYLSSLLQKIFPP